MKFSVALLPLLVAAAQGSLRNNGEHDAKGEHDARTEGRELNGGSYYPHGACVWNHADTCPHNGRGHCDSGPELCENPHKECKGSWYPDGCKNKPPHHNNNKPAHHNNNKPPPQYGQQPGYGYPPAPHYPPPQQEPPHYEPPAKKKYGGDVKSKYINKNLKFGDKMKALHVGPFKVNAKCTAGANDNSGEDEGITSGSNNVELEIMATNHKMDEDILVYGVGYTLIPGFFSNRVVQPLMAGVTADYQLFRVSDFFRFTDDINFFDAANITQGFVANNPFNGAFASSDGYHVGIDGDSCVGVVRSANQDFDDDDVNTELDDFFGDDAVDCIVSCTLHYSEPEKKEYHHPW